MLTEHNFEPGNAGIIFWTDILIPLIGVARALKKRPRAGTAQGSVCQRGLGGLRQLPIVAVHNDNDSFMKRGEFPQGRPSPRKTGPPQPAVCIRTCQIYVVSPASGPRAAQFRSGSPTRNICANSVSEAVNRIMPLLLLSSRDLMSLGRSRRIVECNCH
jgi:hypothetical protein